MLYTFKVTKDIINQFIEVRKDKENFSVVTQCILALTMKPVFPDVRIGISMFGFGSHVWRHQLPVEAARYISEYVDASEEELQSAPELEFQVEV